MYVNVTHEQFAAARHEQQRATITGDYRRLAGMLACYVLDNGGEFDLDMAKAGWPTDLRVMEEEK